MKRLPLAMILAWEDLKDRYRRSYLGLAWIVLSFLVFILVKTLIFGNLFKSPNYDYFSHLVIGFALFRFISLSINGASNLFISCRMWVLSTNLPYTLYANTLVIRSLVEFGLLAATAGILVTVKGAIHITHIWSLFPAIALYYITALGLCMILGSLGARYRDLVHAMQTIMRVLYFLTPVFWVAVPGTAPARIAMWNPLTYYLDIVRVPLMEGLLPVEAWVICLMITCAICLSGIIIFSQTKKLVPLWL